MKLFSITKKIYLIFLTAFFSILFFTGCPVTTEFTVNSKNEVYLNFDTTAGKELSKLIKSFDSDDSETDSDFVLFDHNQINKALIEAGFSDVHSFSKNGKKENLSVTAKINSSEQELIQLEGKKIKITFSPQKLQHFFIEKDSIIQKYADLLMAPCFTNEELEPSEYLDIIASLYGNGLATELTLGELVLSTAKSRIEIPLMEILCLREEKIYYLDL